MRGACKTSALCSALQESEPRADTGCEETLSTTHADDDAQRSPPTPTRRNNERTYGAESRALVCPIYSLSKISNL